MRGTQVAAAIVGVIQVEGLERSFKMAGAALVPFGKEIVSLSALASAPAGAVVVPETR